MPVPLTYVAYFMAVLVANLVVVWLVIKRTSLDRGSEDEAGGEGRVRCPECGRENDAWYQFCESCLEDLSSA